MCSHLFFRASFVLFFLFLPIWQRVEELAPDMEVADDSVYQKLFTVSGHQQLPPKFALRAISIRAQNMSKEEDS
ncbi:uncharacterized protein ARMOST_02952 [Armillaria ostoyae]|uniref:Secreted protein n=1 Tax=Armillaria ostoyae TaxID=47428 RepID=A0A284QT24_ARMOS|nr:uncharacterized protein ARMOST_02952 [Armillaria ostoyae]